MGRVSGEDLQVPNRYASGFFATDLVTLLMSRGVDTVLIGDVVSMDDATDYLARSA